MKGNISAFSSNNLEEKFNEYRINSTLSAVYFYKRTISYFAQYFKTSTSCCKQLS